MFGSGGDEDDLPARGDGAGAVDDAGVDEAELCDGFVAQDVEYLERHAVIGIEIQMLYAMFAGKIACAADKTGQSAGVRSIIAQQSQFGINGKIIALQANGRGVMQGVIHRKTLP